MREERDDLLEVTSARLVDVEIAVAAAVAGEARELGSADVAHGGGRAIVLLLHKHVWIGEVSSISVLTRRHGFFRSDPWQINKLL